MARFKKRSSSFIDDGDDSDAPKTSKSTKKAKTATSGSGEGKDAEGNPYWELSSKRRVGISEFKSNLLINIREYYDADGEMKPGKKGISLSIDQYQALLKAIPAINKELRKKGHEIGDLETSAAAPVEVAKPAKAKKKEPKSNFEATSDEDEDSG